MRRVEKLFRPTQIHAMGLALIAEEQAEARKRMAAGGKGAKISHPSRAMDRIGANFGISGRQVEKIADVCRAAEADPDRFGHLREEMDRTGKVNGAHTKLGKLQEMYRIEGIVPVEGRFRTLVFDVPWGEDNVSESAGHAYALMRFDEILGLKDQMNLWADLPFCHLWFWATSNTLPLAFKALEHFEFDYKTSHVWNKPKWGRGRYARNKAEFLLFAMRGDQGCKPAFMSTPTVHDWPMPDGPESTKPDGSYDVVRKLSYGPYGEAFQRTERPDFVNLYQPAPAAILEAAE